MTITEEYQKIKQNGKKLDMSRGKPSSEQFDKMEKLLSQININKDCYSENGTDCRNYGGLDGIPEAKRVFSSMLEIPEENIAVGGNSSLNLMYDLIAQAFVFGIRGQKPWSAQKTKFLCPVPGYDRHFAITEHFGIEMISVPMLPTGPDMDIVEKLVSTDSSIKGIWNVPKYSNPTGVTYSDDTVLHFASLKPAAKDFCIIWDDAYCVHDLNDTPDNLLNLFAQAQKFKNENNVYIFASTSKITYSGAGISCIASSKDNIKEYLNELSIHTICNDKLNMLRHAKLLQSKENVLQIMDMHKSVISKKFDLCIEYFKNEL
ncbi:MAG: aminotransferase, partial [Clostridia bacterium]